MNPEEYELSKDNFICVPFLVSLALFFALFTTVLKKTLMRKSRLLIRH